jgi:tripartite-type tricarboxylate transporter receptor subunit TctC
MNKIIGPTFGLAALLFTGSASAQTAYPEKPIRMTVGVATGSQTDTIARLLSQKFAEAWSKPVVIDTVTGAAGNIAADRVAKAPPDGYTLGLLSQTPVVVNPGLYKLAYDSAKDFAPVSQVAISPLMLVVHNAVPAKSVKELVALAKAQPGTLTFASSGNGSGNHIAAELFKSMAGIDIRHVPYKSVVMAVPDLMGEPVTMTFSNIVVVLSLAREGKLRALAVTSLKRSSTIAELPTVAESGYLGFEFSNWFGLLAPARTPATIVSKLHLETVKALSASDLRGKLADIGSEGIGNSPDAFAAIIKSEIPKWAKVIKDAGIRVE